MTPDQKVANVEAQINACMRGATDVITCPYCGTHVRVGDESLCCADLGLVVHAVLQKQDTQRNLEKAMRITQRMADMAAQN